MRLGPQSVGTLHFVGIGGIGMSGIAEILVNLGYSVQGSDISENANVQRLRGLGVKVAIGHAAENVDGASVLIVSSAVKPENPELAQARARLLPIVRRAEMLGELMRLRSSVAVGGTHGKTTTTSMVGWLLETAGLDPTVINGGIINAYGTNARLGTGDFMVVEADESDGTFLKLPATVAIVTNIDPEHLDHYKDFEAVRTAFASFVTNIPFYGFAVLCIDHPEVQALLPRVSDRKVVTYGLSPQADVRAINIRPGRDGFGFDVAITSRVTDARRVIEGLTLPMFGEHNVQNSCAALAVGVQLGLSDDVLRRALATFSGVKRRFTRTGSHAGITVIDDYGHHPVEIAAVLRAGRQALGGAGAGEAAGGGVGGGGVGSGQLIAVVQPHRYTRLRDLFDEFCTCFNDADVVICAEVYAAGEAPIEGVSRDALVAGLQARGHRHVEALAGPAELAPLVARIARPGDYVICLGAGSVTQWAAALPGQLAALLPSEDQAAAGAGI